MRLSLLIPAAATLGLMSGCAPTTQGEGPPAEARACFLSSSLQNFRADETVLYVRSSRNEVFEVQVAGYCRDLSSANAVSVTTFGGSSISTCVGDTVNVVVSGLGSGGHSTAPCQGRVQRRLTDTEIAGLDSRLRP